MTTNNPTNKVNGHAVAGEHLTSQIDYFTISTPVNLNTAVATNVNATGADSYDTALDKLIEIVSLRGQPVIMGSVAGTGPYTLKFATEHKGSWNVTGTMLVDNSAVDLAAAIVQHGVDFGFDANTTVTVSSSL